jgi:hypothetical protein
LIEALQQGEAQELSINLEQARQYREDDNARACQTALRQLEEGAKQSTTADNRGGDSVGQEGAPEGSQITVESGAPQIRVQQAAPDVRVQQQQPTVTVDPGQPEIVIHQPAPTINVQIPRPQVTLLMPEPDVDVSTSEPQVSVDQADPQIEVIRPSQAEAQSQTRASAETPEPIVRYESEDPRIDVSQTGEVEVRMETREVEREGSNAMKAADERDPDMAAQQDMAEQQQNRDLERDRDMAAQDMSGRQGMAEREQGEQQTAANERRSQEAGAGTRQLTVAELKGMELMDAEQGSIGTIELVIIDSDDRPFVIIDRGDDQAAVLVSLTRSQENHLVLRDGMDESSLPAWTQDELGSNGIRELEDNQQIRLQTAG